MKLVLSMAAAAVCVTAMSSALVAPAHAKAYCVYLAKDTSGRQIKTAGTHRNKMGTACERARKKCNFSREYWGKRGKFGRSDGCLKFATANK